MVREDFEAFERVLNAIDRQDVDAVVKECDPEVEWHPSVAAVMQGEATVFRGHAALRRGIQDLFDAFADLHFEPSELRDLGDELLVVGQIRAHGTESGVQIESPWAYRAVFSSDHKAILVRGYLDPEEAIEAAGLSK